jgi:hypothetical protein
LARSWPLETSATRELTVARTFSIYTTVDPPSLLARFERVAKQNGATLVGDEESGSFSHDTKSDYIIMHHAEEDKA